MPKFVIERELPGAGKLSSQELHAIAQKSCGVLSAMGPHVQSVQSGLPANVVARVRSVIDPTAAE